MASVFSVYSGFSAFSYLRLAMFEFIIFLCGPFLVMFELAFPGTITLLLINSRDFVSWLVLVMFLRALVPIILLSLVIIALLPATGDGATELPLVWFAVDWKFCWNRKHPFSCYSWVTHIIRICQLRSSFDSCGSVWFGWLGYGERQEKLETLIWDYFSSCFGSYIIILSDDDLFHIIMI